MNSTESRNGAENGDAPHRTTTPVRIRKTDLKRLEQYQVDGDDTPAAAISRVIDMYERDREIVLRIGEILPLKRVARTDELITKTEELIDLLRSEKQ